MTDGWRALGVFLGGRISEASEILVLVRAVATALVAAVIANLVFFPAGALAGVDLAVRILAFATGFGAYLFARKNVLAGIIAAETVLAIGMFAT